MSVSGGMLEAIEEVLRLGRERADQPSGEPFLGSRDSVVQAFVAMGEDRPSAIAHGIAQLLILRYVPVNSDVDRLRLLVEDLPRARVILLRYMAQTGSRVARSDIAPLLTSDSTLVREQGIALLEYVQDESD